MTIEPTASIDVPEEVAVHALQFLVHSGVELSQAKSLAQPLAKAVLESYALTASLPFDKTKKWTPGERVKVSASANRPPEFALVVRIERTLRVEDHVVVIIDGTDTARRINSDVLSHCPPPVIEGPSVLLEDLPEDAPEEDSEELARAAQVALVTSSLLKEEPNTPSHSRRADLGAVAEVIVGLMHTLPTDVRAALGFGDVDEAITQTLHTPRLLSARQVETARRIISGKEVQS